MTFKKVGGKSIKKAATNYSSQNKYLLLKIVPLPSFHLQLRGSFVPHRDPLLLAGFPWLVHLCPADGGCRWDSMGSAVPGTSGTGRRWGLAAEGEQITISLKSGIKEQQQRPLCRLTLMSAIIQNAYCTLESSWDVWL